MSESTPRRTATATPFFPMIARDISIKPGCAIPQAFVCACREGKPLCARSNPPGAACVAAPADQTAPSLRGLHGLLPRIAALVRLAHLAGAIAGRNRLSLGLKRHAVTQQRPTARRTVLA